MKTTNITLSKVTREKLLTFAKSIPGAWIGLKVAALLLVLEGQRPGWIAQVLGLTRMSLNRWIRAVNEKGIQALVSKSRPGRPSKLTQSITRQVEQHLEQSPRIWIKPCSMGWPHFSGSLKATFWGKAESAPGSELDAPVGLPPEASQLYISASQGRRSQKVPKGFKKNLIHWDHVRLWSSKMRQGLRCILDWVWAGLKGVNLCEFRPQVNINSDLMFLAGLLRCWDDTVLYGQNEEIGKVF